MALPWSQAGANSSLAANLSEGALPSQPRRSSAAAVGAALLLLSLAGNALLLRRLRCCGRRRLDFLVCQLALADLYGSGLLLLLPWFPDVEGSDAACRLLRLLRGSAALAPSHVVVLIALERHGRLRRPSTASASASSPRPPSRGALAALGWLPALLLALPEAFVFRLTDDGRCLSVFPRRPRWQGLAYAVYGAVRGFVAPAFLLGATCGRLLRAFGGAEKEEEEAGRPSRGAPAPAPHGLPACPPRRPSWLFLGLGKCGAPSSPQRRQRRRRRRPPPRSLLRLRLLLLPRARPRSVQLALALGGLFALCGFPRFLLELGWAFSGFPDDGDGDGGPSTAAALLAASPAALNPYLCLLLLFHGHRPWARRLRRSLCRCHPDGSQPQPRRRRRRGARHRPPLPPPPQAALERGPRWLLCPCQARREEGRSPAVESPGPSGL